MGGRLNEAEIKVHVSSLHEEHECNLDGAVVKCFNWTPLHAAASSGQLELFQQLLSSSPELADALDSQQRSLLHLASANGHIGIVKALTKVRPEMCLARDRDGANPLHVAAMRGKVEVLDELFQANPHAARAYRVDRGERETILHICVKYNQLQFLQMLLEKYFKGEEFVNAKDNAGNTILHLAVADRRFQIIKHVLSDTEIHVNATNESKQTAMDILLLGQKKGTKPKGVDYDIQVLLQKHAKRFKDAVDPTKLPERKNGIIVAAVLMATLAFQAGVAPPCGVWQDD
ncbi:ankyrin repeat-containing protein BDA1-like isoform X2 [Rhododendron vialii]|uniref:ankyrin repeat-containing protein BDA1-like isoform X2 n=1 Tax=Rhododendron vialii TaxID=182163 RepID=UPI00265EE381|nr:ankyrin repeat-containing protein BDA1-like isoform X2 [Rhododendron vialii]